MEILSKKAMQSYSNTLAAKLMLHFSGQNVLLFHSDDVCEYEI